MAMRTNATAIKKKKELENTADVISQTVDGHLFESFIYLSREQAVMTA